MSKLIKVNCSYCGNEMDCPEDMAKMTNNHMCEKCVESPKIAGKLSEFAKDLEKPLNDMSICVNYADKLVEATFLPEITDEEFSKLSRKELAKEMFVEGATSVFYGLLANGKSEKDLKEIVDFHKKAKEISKKLKF